MAVPPTGPIEQPIFRVTNVSTIASWMPKRSIGLINSYSGQPMAFNMSLKPISNRLTGVIKLTRLDKVDLTAKLTMIISSEEI